MCEAGQHPRLSSQGAIRLRGTKVIDRKEYETESEAKKAVVELDGRCLNGQRIIAEFAKPKSNDTIYRKILMNSTFPCTQESILGA